MLSAYYDQFRKQLGFHSCLKIFRRLTHCLDRICLRIVNKYSVEFYNLKLLNHFDKTLRIIQIWYRYILSILEEIYPENDLVRKICQAEAPLPILGEGPPLFSKNQMKKSVQQLNNNYVENPKPTALKKAFTSIDEMDESNYNNKNTSNRDADNYNSLSRNNSEAFSDNMESEESSSFNGITNIRFFQI